MEENRVEILKKLGLKQASFAALATDQNEDLVKLVQRVEQLENLCFFLTELVVDADAAKRVNDLKFSTPPGTRSWTEKDKEEEEKLINGVSLNRINEEVEELLSRPTTNFGWIPDALERRIDRRILQLVLGVIAQTVNKAAVKVGDNHELTFSLQPHKGPETATEEEKAPAKPGNMDVVVFTALKSILNSVTVEFLGHELQLHLQ